MKVFISWSGSLSKRLGEALRDWLPGVIQSVEPYFTPSDIEKGGRWASDIAKELSAAEVGVLCITRDNIHSDWILFEAGALSKSLDKSHVCPILFDINNADLAGPLKQFQTTEFSKADFHKLMTVINGRLGERKLPAKTLDVVFEKWWPDLELKIKEILSSVTIIDGPLRDDREVLEEILMLARASSRHNQTPFPVKLVEELLAAFIKMHDAEMSESGGYQDSLDNMKGMMRSLQVIARKMRGASPEIERLNDLLQALSFETESNRLFGNDDDVPF